MGGPTYAGDAPGYLQQQNLKWLTGDEYPLHLGAPTDPGDVDYTDPPTYYPFNVAALTYSAYLEGSPFGTAFAYDPESDLDEIEGKLTEYAELVEALDPREDYDTYHETALAKADILFSDPAEDQFDAATLASHARSMNRITGPLFGANAAEGSTLALVLAVNERSRKAELATYAANRDSQKAQFVSNEIRTMMNALGGKMTAQQSLQTFWAHYFSERIISFKEFINEELEYARQDALWDLSLMKHGEGMMGALSGAPGLMERPNPVRTNISTGLQVLGTIAPIAMALS